MIQKKRKFKHAFGSYDRDLLWYKYAYMYNRLFLFQTTCVLVGSFLYTTGIQEYSYAGQQV